VSAYPATSIEHFDTELHQAGVADRKVAGSTSGAGEVVVAALYSASVIPVMMGWLYFLIRWSGNLIIYVIS